MKPKKSKDSLPVSQKELERLTERLNEQYQQEGKVALEGRSAQTLVACLNSLSVILEMLSKARMRIGAVRNLFGIKVEESGKADAEDGEGDCESEGISRSEQSDPAADDDQMPPSDQSGASDEGETADSPSAESASSSRPDNKESNDSSRSKHGPRHGDEFPNATRIDCHVPGLKKGDDCPAENCKGKLYAHQKTDSPRQLIVFDAHTPIATTVYALNDLQCNLCSALFKAELPADLREKGVERGEKRVYTCGCLAFILVAHYYFGRSFRSLEQLTGMIGDRIADSTLNGKALEQREFLAKLRGATLAIASRCSVLYGDDIGSKVISILPEIKKSRNGEYVCRNGIYTSIVIGITDDGKPIPIFTTGLHHLGETFDRVLADRPSGLPPPVVIRDQSSSNKITACQTISAGCLQHARDYFVKARKNYPDECDEILEKMGEIFEIDRKTHDMNPMERLGELKKISLPIMQEVLSTVDGLIDAKEATPSSDMGIALAYFKKYYPSMMIPYEIPGIGLTNNLSEWMTYPVVRYLNNCRHYATEEGAEVGDYVISLTMLALLSSRNPIKYIEYLLLNESKLDTGAIDAFLPWNIPLDQVPELEKEWFTNWIPCPGPDGGQPNSNPLTA